ncbi:hypothetical protein J6590_031703 [Homalodisca vitripennis]|nr:hypothetical protein J6590_031703 [Homalodisca vitripennis]
MGENYELAVIYFQFPPILMDIRGVLSLAQPYPTRRTIAFSDLPRQVLINSRQLGTGLIKIHRSRIATVDCGGQAEWTPAGSKFTVPVSLQLTADTNQSG